MKILILNKKILEPDKSAGCKRLFNLIEILSDQHEIFYFPKLVYLEQIQYRQNLEGLGVRVLTDNFFHFVTILKKHSFDLILFEFYSVAHQYLDLVSYYQKNGILVTDSVDVHFNRTQNEMANKLITESYFKKEKKRELSVYKKSNVTIVVSKEDGSILESHGVNHVSIISIIVPSATRKLIENEKKSIIFVGGFIHRPNVKAIEWFLGNVWDKIKSQNKNIVFNIVGSNLPDRLVKQIDSLKDVNYLGFIANLNEEYDKSILAIAPLTYGGGVKGKVCEAMAHGIPLVTTTVGVEGIQAINGKDCFIADNVDEFAQRVLQLADDTELQVLFTKNSQILADKTCGMENAKSQVGKLLINLDEIKVEKPSRSYMSKIIKANYQLAKNSMVHLSKKIRKKSSI